MSIGRPLALSLGLALAVVGTTRQVVRSSGWPNHGGNPQHMAISDTPAQRLSRVVWSTPLDLAPQYNGDVLYAHYGSPVVTDNNIVVVPVKTGATGGFRIEAHSGSDGALLWKQDTDYVTPGHNWFPTLGPTIAAKTNVAFARKAGLVSFRYLPASGTTTNVCFYGMANYQANPAAYDGAVRICSPLISTTDGTVYFAYRVEGTTPLGLKGGIAMVRRDGTARYVEGAAATGDADFTRPKLNAAPAVTADFVYAVFKNGGNDGMLVCLSARNLAPRFKAALRDPRNGGYAYTDDDGTACPTVGPDGDVYMGVLENPFGTHHYRGWLLHFDALLSQPKTPGSFGWDDTASVVPSSIVPSYAGTSRYLLLTKYNNYAGAGDGVNRMALLDPNATQTDPYSGATTMKEVLTQVGPTPDAEHTGSFPNAVREWCVNTAAIDVAHKSAFVNNEDGAVYRWNFATNTLDQRVQLTTGIGEAYTSTIVGANGLVYAISNARLYAVGQ